MRLDDVLKQQTGAAEQSAETEESLPPSEPDVGGTSPPGATPPGAPAATGQPAAPDNQDAPPGQTADQPLLSATSLSLEASHLEAPPPKLESPATAIASLGQTGPQPGGTGRPARNALAPLDWHFTGMSRRGLVTWAELPTPNRILSVLGGVCLLWAATRLSGPPLAASVHQAVFPYTAAGKQALCATRLSSLAQALALYAQNNDGRFPPTEGRYRRAYLRSQTPFVFALLEVGQRASYIAPQPIK